MKHIRKQTDIEDFIEYKLNHQSESEENARALLLKKKSQLFLDQLYKIISSKKVELEALRYETKKIHKKNMERYEKVVSEEDQIEGIIEDEELLMKKKKQNEETKELWTQEKKKDVKKKEETIKQRKEQAQTKINHKTQTINELTSVQSVLLSKIEHLESATFSYKSNIRVLEEMKNRVNFLEEENRELEEEVGCLNEILGNLNVKVKEEEEIRKEKEMEECEERRQEMGDFILEISEQLDNMKSEDESIEALWGFINNKHEALESKLDEPDRELNEEKLFKIDAFRELYQNIRFKDNKEALIKIKPSITQKHIKELEEAKKLFLQVEAQQKETMNNEGVQIEKENSKDKEIRNLEETIAKIDISLNKV